MATKTKKLPKRRKPSADATYRDLASQDQSDDAIRIEGLKYFAMLQPLLEHLQEDHCERDKAGNRNLHYDQYCILVLLYVLNPTVSSLRSLSQASELTKVQTRLGTKKASLSSLSESSRLFQADRLKSVIEKLSSQVSATQTDPRLADLPGKLTAVDGTLVNALPSLITASILKQTCGSGLVRWRLHTHFEVNNLVPSRRGDPPQSSVA